MRRVELGKRETQQAQRLLLVMPTRCTVTAAAALEQVLVMRCTWMRVRVLKVIGLTGEFGWIACVDTAAVELAVVRLTSADTSIILILPCSGSWGQYPVSASTSECVRHHTRWFDLYVHAATETE